MPPLPRFKVIVSPHSIALCHVIDTWTDKEVEGVIDIAWQYAPDGDGQVVLTFDAAMIGFEVTPPVRSTPSDSP
jgi:hypothetical protein